MAIFIVTDAGFPEPGAQANATLRTIVADDANAAAKQVAQATGQTNVLYFLVDSVNVQAVQITADMTLTATPIEIPPIGDNDTPPEEQ